MGRPVEDDLTVGEFVRWTVSQPERAAQRLLAVGAAVAREMRWSDAAGDDAVADLSTLVFVRKRLSGDSVPPTTLLADWIRGVLVRRRHRGRIDRAREHGRIVRIRTRARMTARVRDAKSADLGSHRTDIEGQLALLTPKQREVVRMRAAGHGARMIAGLLGIDRSSVRERLARARRAITAAQERSLDARASSTPVVGGAAPPLPTELDRRVWSLRTAGRTIRQIAAATGTTPAAVRSRLQRLRRRAVGW